MQKAKQVQTKKTTPVRRSATTKHDQIKDLNAQHTPSKLDFKALAFSLIFALSLFFLLAILK